MKFKDQKCTVAGDLVKSNNAHSLGILNDTEHRVGCSIMSHRWMQRRTCYSALQICVSTPSISAELTWSINSLCLKGAWVEFYSQRSNEMTRNWPSGHMGLILYHHPHGNWLCIVLLCIISELYWECMSHKSAQSFKVYSSERQQWFPRD